MIARLAPYSVKKNIPVLLICIVIAGIFVYFDRQQTEISNQLQKLQSVDNQVRVNAVMALGETGSSALHSAPEIIKAMVKDETGYPNHPYYIEALKKIGYNPSSDLMKAVINKDYRVNFQVVNYLATIMKTNNPEKIKTIAPALIKVFKGNNKGMPLNIDIEDVRKRALRALGSFEELAIDAVPALIEGLKDEDPSVRSAVAGVLCRMGPIAVKATIPTLITLLQNEKYYIRHDALGVLERIGPFAKEAIPTLTATLNDEDAGVASRAKQVLNVIGPAITQLPEELFQDFKSKDQQKAYETRDIFRKLGPASDEMTQYLINILKRKDKSDYTMAIFALGEIGPLAGDAVPTLIPFLNSENYNLRYSTVTTLGQLKTKAERAIPALTEAFVDSENNNDLNKYVRIGAARALGSIGPKAFPTLIKLLGHKDAFVRAHAAQTIGGSWVRTIQYPATKDAIPGLRKALKDDDDEVRTEAALALGLIGWEESEAIPILLDVLNAPMPQDPQLSSSVGVHKMGAFLSLSRIGTPEAKKHIEQFKAKIAEKSKANN